MMTKLFWGLAVLYGLGIFLSPVNRKGINIFLSPGNQSDVLRQVSNNGIIAVGMTLVILTGGIDLSVGSMMALGCMLCAMLLTLQGWTTASASSIPILALVCLLLCAYLVPLIAINLRRGSRPVESRVRVFDYSVLFWGWLSLDCRFGGPQASCNRSLLSSGCSLLFLQWALR
jgi:ABC-type glucose/galactose transport system permease subunit